MNQKCNHRTAMVMRRRKDYTYMLCTGQCRQVYVMAKTGDGRHEEQPSVVDFFVEREKIEDRA